MVYGKYAYVSHHVFIRLCRTIFMHTFPHNFKRFFYSPFHSICALFVEDKESPYQIGAVYINGMPSDMNISTASWHLYLRDIKWIIISTEYAVGICMNVQCGKLMSTNFNAELWNAWYFAYAHYQTNSTTALSLSLNINNALFSGIRWPVMAFRCQKLFFKFFYADRQEMVK